MPSRRAASLMLPPAARMACSMAASVKIRRLAVCAGTGGTFSLEGPEGKAFHTRSRVFTDAELAELAELEKEETASN